MGGGDGREYHVSTRLSRETEKRSSSSSLPSCRSLITSGDGGEVCVCVGGGGSSVFRGLLWSSEGRVISPFNFLTLKETPAHLTF